MLEGSEHKSQDPCLAANCDCRRGNITIASGTRVHPQQWLMLDPFWTQHKDPLVQHKAP